MLTELLSLTVLAGLLAACVVLCFEKWGLLRAWEVHRPDWLMHRCDFCLGWWVSIVLCQVLAKLAGGMPLWAAVLASFGAAAVARHVVNFRQ